jgi:hypothetical protein
MWRYVENQCTRHRRTVALQLSLRQVDRWLHRTNRADNQNDQDTQSLFTQNVTAKAHQPDSSVLTKFVGFDQSGDKEKTVQGRKSEHTGKQNHFHDKELAVRSTKIPERPDQEPRIDQARTD